MTKLKISKLIVFMIAGILVITFHTQLNNYVPYLVGSAMLVYGIIGVVNKFLYKTSKEELYSLVWSDFEILLGCLMIFMLSKEEDLTKVCVLWASWAILREAKEINEIIEHLKTKDPFILNAIESIASVVLSILLIKDPLDHYHIHVIFLGIELIGYVLFPFMVDFKHYYIEKHQHVSEEKIDN